jgi:hypothetical protein
MLALLSDPQDSEGLRHGGRPFLLIILRF